MTSGPFPSGFKVFAIDLNPMLLGWIDLVRAAFFGATFTYSSVDGHTFVVACDTDLSGILAPGHRLKITQDITNTPTTYYIVTKVGSYSGGTMSITLYGGTDYSLENATITACSFSPVKAPYGFPLDPAKWAETLASASSVLQSSPSNGTWYNPGSLSIDLPIGVWTVAGKVALYSPSGKDGWCSLSTSASSESDVDITVSAQANPSTETVPIHKRSIALTAKTTYYLIFKTDNSAAAVGSLGPDGKLVIDFVCAYL